FFDRDKAVSKTESYPALDRIASVMQETPDQEIQVSGHTALMGRASYNQGLSRLPSPAVLRYLTHSPTNRHTPAVTSRSESQPSESNETDEGRSRNRRVEFKIVKL